MPRKRYISKVLKKNKASSARREFYQRKQMTCVQRNKENSITDSESTHLVSDNDPLMACVKIEIEEPTLSMNSSQFDFNQHQLDVPIKIENFEPLDCRNIKQEQEDEGPSFTSLPIGSNRDLNILIEWALNLQFDHSQKCQGRLYPCKEILDNFSSKIVVLYCTVCKKKMLHTLKDWTTL